MNLRVSFLFFLLLTLAVTTLRSAESEPVRDKFVEAQLISSHAKIAPGQTFQLGLKFTIDDTWHTYWSNPGETGKPTTLDLTPSRRIFCERSEVSCSEALCRRLQRARE